MDNTLSAKLTAGIRKLQSLVGESVVINTITYTTIIGSEVLTDTLKAGGWEQASHVSISISLADILASPVAPAVGNTALLMPRNRTYRLETITPTQTTWELGLIDITA